MRIALIAAVADNGVIGKDNELPWRIPGDLKFFKSVTLGKPVIMGRKTWESLPFKPLPGRLNIIVTRNASYEAEGGEVVSTLDQAFERGKKAAQQDGIDEVIVMGGAEIYNLALEHADRLYLTEVHMDVEGDAFFPDIARQDWAVTEKTSDPGDGADIPPHDFVTLEKL